MFIIHEEINQENKEKLEVYGINRALLSSTDKQMLLDNSWVEVPYSKEPIMPGHYAKPYYNSVTNQVFYELVPTPPPTVAEEELEMLKQDNIRLKQDIVAQNTAIAELSTMLALLMGGEQG